MRGAVIAFRDGTDGESEVSVRVGGVELALSWNAARDIQLEGKRALIQVNGYISGTS